jgi:hypothetical protein
MNTLLFVLLILCCLAIPAFLLLSFIFVINSIVDTVLKYKKDTSINLFFKEVENTRIVKPNKLVTEDYDDEDDEDEDTEEDEEDEEDKSDDFWKG